MHGTLKGSIYGANEVNLASKKNPTFDINSFANCTGPIISGHVHVAGCYESHRKPYGQYPDSVRHRLCADFLRCSGPGCSVRLA